LGQVHERGEIDKGKAADNDKAHKWTVGSGGADILQRADMAGRHTMNDIRNTPLIGVLKRGLAREEEKIEHAKAEIIKLKLELLELGVELPLNESLPNVTAINKED
jgi:hypothetical protein